LFLSKLEYFNSSGAPDRNIKQSSRLSNNSRVAVNNSINRAKQSHYNANQEVTKSFNKSSPGLLSASHRKTEDQQQHQGGSAALKKPLFVTKYSPYRGDNAKHSAPLIMTAENGETSQTSQKKDPKFVRPERTTRSAIQKPSQLPGLRASFLNFSEKTGLTSASLHKRSYSYQEGPPAPLAPLAAVNKPSSVRKFVSYKTKSSAAVSEPAVTTEVVTPRSRKWLTKRINSSEEKNCSELECLNKLRLTNKMILEQHSITRTKVEPSLATIPQDTELCEDCTAETEEDSGIFTSSHSKYSLDDEMIESDDPPLSSPRDSASKEIRNFSSDSDEMCSRETSPMQLLADLLRKPADSSTERRPEGKNSLVQLRKQQFEEETAKLETTRRSFDYHRSARTAQPQSNIDFTKISNININIIPQHLSRSSQSSQREVEKSPNKEPPEDVGLQPSQMESSMVSNTSRLSVCTDCTGSSEENENKFFDDDYNDQQQLILNSEEEQTYDESLFDVVDGLLQGEGNNPIINENKEAEGIRTSGQPQVQRVKEILEEESERDRKVSVDTLSSGETDICMLDLEDGFPPLDDTPDGSRPDSPVRNSSCDLIVSDVVSIKKLLIQLQGLLSHEESSAREKIEEENSELRRELTLLRLKVAERDRRISMLERRLQYSRTISLQNIATQTQHSEAQGRSKPRPLSWDLTSISLVRNINKL